MLLLSLRLSSTVKGLVCCQLLHPDQVSFAMNRKSHSLCILVLFLKAGNWHVLRAIRHSLGRYKTSESCVGS